MTTGERIKDCIRHLVFGFLGAAIALSILIPDYIGFRITLSNIRNDIKDNKIEVDSLKRDFITVYKSDLDTFKNELERLKAELTNTSGKINTIEKDYLKDTEEIEKAFEYLGKYFSWIMEYINIATENCPKTSRQREELLNLLDRLIGTLEEITKEFDL